MGNNAKKQTKEIELALVDIAPFYNPKI